MRADPRRLLPDRYFLYGDYSSRPAERAAGTTGRLGRSAASSGRAPAAARGRASRPGDGATRLLLTSRGLDVPALIRFIRDVLPARAAPPGRLEVDRQDAPRLRADGGPYREAFKDEPRVRVVPGIASPSTATSCWMADFHLSVSSSCHYDALGLGVPTVVLGLPTHDYVKHLCDEGLAFFATAADSCPSSRTPKPAGAPGCFRNVFRPGALKETPEWPGHSGGGPDPPRRGKGVNHAARWNHRLRNGEQ